jgi:Fe-S-cluster formation regulator IscX/YfhJ
MMRLLNTRTFEKLVFILFMVASMVVFVMIFSSQTSSNTETPSIIETHKLPLEYNNGAWIWEPINEMDEETTNKILSFAKEKNIRTLYVFIEAYLSIVQANITEEERVTQIADFNSKVRTFLNKANEQGIAIEALAGNVNWGEEANRYIPITFTDYVLNYNADPQNEVKFAGIHFDIEFYNQENFKDDKQGYSERFLELVEILADKVKGKDDFVLGFAVPHGLDRADGKAPEINFNGVKRVVLSHMIELLKESNAALVLMSYRNYAEGNNGTIDISKRAFKISDDKKSNVKIYIGMETVENEVKNITFYGMDDIKLYESVVSIQEEFGDNPVFSGFAIHTLDGYMELTNPEE